MKTARWLDHHIQSVEDLIAPAGDDVLVPHPVSTRVGSPKNNDPSLVEPVELAG